MNQKPGDFFIGVIDLFVIILPGVLFNFFMLYFLWNYPIDKLPCNVLSAGAKWAVFIMVSYILGHIISYAGTFVDKFFYRDDLKLIESDTTGIRDRAVCIANSDLAIDLAENLNIRRWAIAFIRVFNDSAAVYIDRKDADRRFFRNLIVVLLIGLIGFIYKNQISITIITAVLLVISLFRYRDQQRKLSKIVFEFFISMNSRPQGDTLIEKKE